jgi:hypothetical protein
MPQHPIPRARLHEDIISLRAEHEEVVSIVPDPDDSSRFLVTTKYCSDVETRSAS